MGKSTANIEQQVEDGVMGIAPSEFVGADFSEISFACGVSGFCAVDYGVLRKLCEWWTGR